MTPDAKAQVLLVDDGPAARFTLQVLLEDAGYQVFPAESVAEGRRQLVARRYDLAILDLHLADGLGTDLLDDLRLHQPAARVVVLSGSSPEPVAGVALYLTKAESPALMLSRLRSVLEGAQA